METKPCATCGETFARPRNVTRDDFKARRFCSRACAATARRIPLGQKDCINCGATFVQTRSERGKIWADKKYCSLECAYADRVGKRRGGDHWAWKGGRHVDPNGYVHVLLKDDHPMFSMTRNGRYVLEHRLVVAESLGRPLAKHETVHHVNGDRSDNRLENLQLRSGRHGKGQALRCRACGSTDIEHSEL
jgi:hypothetical protein